MPESSYRRHLPHFDARDRNVFVTWNLKGALPAEAIRRLREERERVARLCAPTSGCKPDLPARPRSNAAVADPKEQSLLLEHARRLFRISEDFLDRADHGPRHLSDSANAGIVREALIEGANRWYLLYAFVVMPNHVHALLRPFVALHRVTKEIKRKTAKAINARLGTVGRPFWQDESFDHFPRDTAAFSRIFSYTERNLVAACFCARPEDWRFCSASLRADWPRGSPYPIR